MMFLAIDETLTNIAIAIQEWFNGIENWDWVTITTQAKNWLVGGGMATLVGLTVKYGLPFLKNSNKPLLEQFAVQAEIITALQNKIVSMDESQKTVGNVLGEWIGLQADVNATSRTLTAEQKQTFVDVASKMRLVNNTQITAAANEIDKIVEDNVVTAEEMVDLVKQTNVGQKVLGTNINTIIPKG